MPFHCSFTHREMRFCQRQPTLSSIHLRMEFYEHFMTLSAYFNCQNCGSQSVTFTLTSNYCELFVEMYKCDELLSTWRPGCFLENDKSLWKVDVIFFRWYFYSRHYFVKCVCIKERFFETEVVVFQESCIGKRFFVNLSFVLRALRDFK